MKLLAKRLLSLFPVRLPVGMTAFHKFSDDIIELTGPIADEDSLKYVVASNILHLGAQRARVSKNYFVQTIIKTAANQVASQVFLDIKNKQQEAQKAQAEATAAQEKVNTLNGQQETQEGT